MQTDTKVLLLGAASAGVLGIVLWQLLRRKKPGELLYSVGNLSDFQQVYPSPVGDLEQVRIVTRIIRNSENPPGNPVVVMQGVYTSGLERESWHIFWFSSLARYDFFVVAEEQGTQISFGSFPPGEEHTLEGIVYKDGLVETYLDGVKRGEGRIYGKLRATPGEPLQINDPYAPLAHTIVELAIYG